MFMDRLQGSLAVFFLAGLLPAGFGFQTAAQAQTGVLADGFETGSFCAWTTFEATTTCCGGPLSAESFDGANGSPWPGPWVVGGNVALADLQGGRARLRPEPTGYSLARMNAAFGAQDVEVTFTTRFEDVATQGVGFYVRQNGGYLTETTPAGQGYAVFVEGPFIGTPGIGIWREVDGHEIPIQREPNVPALVNGVDYRVRFRVVQIDPSTTQLAAKLWLAADPEPAAWSLVVTDSTPQLQGIGGDLAIDSWSSRTWPDPILTHTFVDDLEATSLCNPLAEFGPPQLVADSLQFAEGPVWREDHLLLSDITADRILRLDPPAMVTLERSPSDQANGLALDAQGALLACEHGTRRVSRTTTGGSPTTLVDNYQGDRFNSPNDLVVARDGTLYFTDPDYGLTDPNDRELPFNGVFRREADGTLVAEWEGVPGVNQPNGIALSPDETVLYVADTHQGAIEAFEVAPDGSLGAQRRLTAGLPIPDGLCVDSRGTIWVATWGEGLVALAPDGTRWGAVPLPFNATNCAFGGPFGRDLYVTTQPALYRLEP